VKSLLNIYRGRTFDENWTGLFQENQRTFAVTRSNVTIVGTLDFIHDGVLYDLKMPASVYYKKQSGAGQFYKKQVQVYLALAHLNDAFLDVHKARIMMIAEDAVIEEVKEEPDVLQEVFGRAFKLDEALNIQDARLLKGPEEKWECDSKYCAFTKQCKRKKREK